MEEWTTIAEKLPARKLLFTLRGYAVDVSEKPSGFRKQDVG
jgi:hypothetical protein